jgi:hypothetical protein
MCKKKAKTVEPMAETKPAEMKEQETEERAVCFACLETSTGWFNLLALEEGRRACPFCASYLAQGEVLAAPPNLSDDMEMLGAWSQFAGQLCHWYINLGGHCRYWKLLLEERALEEVFRWQAACESDAADVPPLDPEMVETALSLWAVYLSGNILESLAPAYELADALENSIHVSRIRKAIRKPALRAVWATWCSAYAADGLTPLKARSHDDNELTSWTNWQQRGLNYWQYMVAMNHAEMEVKAEAEA